MSASTKTYKGIGSLRVFERTEFNNAYIKTLNITETLPSSINTSGGLQVANTAIFGKSVSILHTMPSTSSITGSLRVEGGIGINATQNSVSIYNGGGLTVAGGGAFEKDVKIGGSVAVGNTITTTDLVVNHDATVSGNLSILGAIEAESIQLAGDFEASQTTVVGLRVLQNSLVEGSQTVLGNTSTGSLTVTSNAPTSFTGDVSILSTTVNTSTTTGALKLSGGFLISSTQAATSVTRGGSFLTLGGAAVAKNLIVGQSVTSQTSNVISNNNVDYNNTTPAALSVTGGVLVGGNVHVVGDSFNRGKQYLTGSLYRRFVTQTVSNVLGTNYSWSQLDNTILVRQGHNDNVIDYLPSAVVIAGSVGNVESGTTVVMHFRNNSTTNNFNVAPGNGGVISPSVYSSGISVPPSSYRTIILRFLTLSTYEIFSVQTASNDPDFEWNPTTKTLYVNGTVQANAFTGNLFFPTLNTFNYHLVDAFTVKDILYEKKGFYAILNLTFTVEAQGTNDFCSFEIGLPDRTSNFANHEDCFGIMQGYEVDSNKTIPVSMVVVKAKVGSTRALVTFLANKAFVTHRFNGLINYRFN